MENTVSNIMTAADNSLTPLDSRIDPICDRDGRWIGTICVYTAGPTSAEPPQWHGDFRELTKWLQGALRADSRRLSHLDPPERGPTST